MNDENVMKLDIDEKGIALVTLNRPKALNALNKPMWEGLRDTAQRIKENPDVRVAIITGAGERAFTAGMDLKMIADGGGGSGQLFPDYREGFDTLYGLKMIFTI